MIKRHKKTSWENSLKMSIMNINNFRGYYSAYFKNVFKMPVVTKSKFANFLN